METAEFVFQRLPDDLLQFGHAGEGVETGRRPPPTRRATTRLQFGHAGEGVETRSNILFDYKGETGLQFGHAGEGVETLRELTWMADGRQASIRPRR